MSNFQEITDRLIEKITDEKVKLFAVSGMADLSDVGNIIGIAIAPYFSEEIGFDKNSFIEGIKHGISLIDGTH